MGDFIPVYLPSEDNVTDLLTKALLRNVTYNFTLDLELWNSAENGGDV